MAEFYGDPDFDSKLGNCLTMLGSEPADGWQEVEPDIWQDEFGVLWDRTVDQGHRDGLQPANHAGDPGRVPLPRPG